MAPSLQKLRERRFWLFQANPKGGDDLRKFLGRKKRGHKIWWRASLYRNPREHMCAEDGVVLWQTRGNQPDAAGVYAVGRLTGNLHHSGKGGWQAQVELDRIRSIEDPISPQKLRSQKILRELPVLRPSGAMGSNFHLTKGEWYGFLSAWGLSRDIGEGPIGEDENPKQERRSSKRTSLAKTRKGSSIVRARGSYEMEWPEDALVEQYVVYMGHKGATMSLRKKGRLRCDLYDDIRKNLIEAKASVARESIRMAIGELADYRRFVKPRYVSVLLPSRPEKDLENLLHTQGIFAIWRSGKGFEDNARGRFS